MIYKEQEKNYKRYYWLWWKNWKDIYKNILFNFPDVKLKYACDINIKETKKQADGLGVKKVTMDYKELLEDGGVNTVFICTLTSTHVGYRLVNGINIVVY